MRRASTESERLGFWLMWVAVLGPIAGVWLNG